MALKWKFETAVEFVQRWSGKDTEIAGTSDEYFEAEEFILDFEPTSPKEAATVLDCVIDNIRTGGRSDGRDIRALATIQSWITRSSGAGIPLTS